MQRVHDKRQIRFAAGCQHACRRETRVVDEQRVLIAVPLDRIWWVRHNSFEWLIIPMLRREQRVVASNIELIKTYIVQEHVDAAEVVGRQVNLLTIETIAHILFAQNLGELQQQRTRTACRVIHLVHLRLAHKGQAAKQIADLLRCEELTTRLARSAGVHGHEELVGITKSVDAVVLVVAEFHIADTIKQFAEFLIALGKRSTQFRAIDIHIGKETCKIAFAVRTHSALLYRAESILQRDIEVGIVLGTTAHIAEELAGQDKEPLCLNQVCARCLRIRIGQGCIVERGVARLVFALVNIIGEVLADIAVEHDTQYILLEIPSVHAAA